MDPAIFFAVGSTPKQIKSICQACLVRGQCLDFALDNNKLGFWGGMSERERHKKSRAQSAKQTKQQPEQVVLPTPFSPSTPQTPPLNRK